jgi:outer membrane protein assembly factor BamB
MGGVRRGNAAATRPLAVIAAGVFILAAASPALATTSDVTQAWPMLGFNAAHTGYNPDEHILDRSTVPDLVLRWSRRTGKSLASGESPVVSESGTVIVPGADFHAHAFNASTGDPLWESSAESESVSGAVTDDLVVFGQTTGVAALDLQTGKTRWLNTSCGGQEVEAAPTVADGTVYAGLNDPELIALRVESGTCLWESPAKMAYDSTSSPAVSNGMVYVGDDAGRLWSVDAADGSVRWHAAATGSSEGSVSTPVATRRRVYATAGNEIGAYKASTGVRVWAFGFFQGTVQFGSPAYARGVLYVGSSDGTVYAFDARTGYEIWTASPGPRADFLLSVANGVVYVSGHRLFALDARSGETLWSRGAGKKGVGWWSAPAIVNGQVYVQGVNGRLYAFGLPPS